MTATVEPKNHLVCKQTINHLAKLATGPFSQTGRLKHLAKLVTERKLIILETTQVLFVWKISSSFLEEKEEIFYLNLPECGQAYI